MDKWIFKMLNQMELEESSFVCESCRQLLTGSIYRYIDDMNYCEACSSKLTELKTKNKELENLLENLFFYCDYCHKFVAKQKQLLLHKTTCKERPITMNCCNDTISDFSIENHLCTKHTLNEIVMSNNVINISPKKLLDEAQYWLATWNNNGFIIRIMQHANCVQVNVAANNPIAGNDTPFITKSIGQNVTGQVMEYRPMFDNTILHIGNATGTLTLPSTNEFDLEIIIGGEISKIKLSECPICMHPLTDKVFLCQNGHIICSDCKPKVDTCGMCREPMGNVFFLLSNLLPNYNNISCPHVADGCLHVLPADKMEDHVNKCKYNDKVNCDVCDKKVAKCNIWEHMRSLHDYNISRFQFGWLHLNFELLPKYCLFDDHIIACKATLISKKFHFNVRVLYASEIEASNYAFKIIDDRKPLICLAQKLCQAHSDYENSISVDYKAEWNFHIIYFKL